MKTAVFLFLFGFFFFAFSCLTGFFFYQNARTKTEPVTGTVIDMVEKRRTSKGRTSRTYAPVVEYLAKGGNKYVHESSSSSNPPAYHVGETVTIYYDPAAPGEAHLPSILEWLLPLIFGLVGLAIMVWSGLGYRKRTKPAEPGAVGGSPIVRYCIAGLLISGTTAQANSQGTPAGTGDTAIFMTKLRQAFIKKDPALLHPLLSDSLEFDWADGELYCPLMRRCPKDKILERYFNGAQAQAWAHFDRTLPTGLTELMECGETFLYAPNFPKSNQDFEDGYAYVFAKNLNVRAEPSSSAKVLGTLSFCHVKLDYNEVCFGTDERMGTQGYGWLPIVYEGEKTAWISTAFTSWSHGIGQLFVQRNALGKLQIVKIIQGRAIPGTWNFPCCGSGEGRLDEELELDDLIANHLAANGGDAWDSIETAVMKINLIFQNQPNLKTEILYTIFSGQAYRMDFSNDMTTSTICVNGSKGWSIAKFGDQTFEQSIDSVEAADLSYQKFIGSPLRRWQEKGCSVSFLGTDTVDGKSAYVVEFDFEPASKYRCYLDSTNLLEIKRVATTQSKGRQVNAEMRFFDYQPVKGVLLPRRMEMVNAKGKMIWEYESIQLDVPVLETVLAKPSSN